MIVWHFKKLPSLNSHFDDRVIYIHSESLFYFIYTLVCIVKMGCGRKFLGEMTKKDIQKFLDINIFRDEVEYQIIETYRTHQFDRHLIKYSGSEEDEVRAFLFIPQSKKVIGGVLVHHQHHGERHLGKSEVSGIIGDPFQFFCPALAKNGIIALAPDSICFEDRRTNKKGIEADVNPDNDWLQHYNEMCYRLLNGTTLMKKVIEDSSIGISVLMQQDDINADHIGILGHSYGGNTVIFHSPFDDRIKYSCSSGAVCSYQAKFENNIGIEMAEVIPSFTTQYDIVDLLKMIHPREILILSAELDKYSKDAKEVYLTIKDKDSQRGGFCFLKEFPGEHGLDKQRFDYIINWFKTKFVS
jgi:dienelactone hydrolase